MDCKHARDLAGRKVCAADAPTVTPDDRFVVARRALCPCARIEPAHGPAPEPQTAVDETNAVEARTIKPAPRRTRKA